MDCFHQTYSSSNTGFVLQTIIKIAIKMTNAYQCPLSLSLLFIFNWISSKFHIWVASIKFSFKFEYMFCPVKDNQDGQQKWPPISLQLWTLYPSQLLLDCFQISYMDYFYQTLAQVRIWALSDNQDGHWNGDHLSECCCGHSQSFITQFLTNFIYGLLLSNYYSCQNMDLSDER